MKTLSAVIVTCLFAFAIEAALPQPDLLIQLHFSGAQKIFADPHVNAFTNEFCSPEALAFRERTAARVSEWLSGWLQSNLNTKVPDAGEKLRPLFDDLQRSEFFLEVRDVNNRPEAAVVIKLVPTRAQLWQDALKPFFPGAAFKTKGEWLIFASNPALIGISDRLAEKITMPSTAWFDIDINWPRLARWYPEFEELALPETQFNVTAPGDYFSINGKFLFPVNLALNLEPWRMPTNTIHVPFSSFTAVRGFSSWWQSQSWAQAYRMTPMPNQFVTWALPMTPVQTFTSVPVPDAGNALSQAYSRLVPIFGAANAAEELRPSIAPEMVGQEIDFPRVPWVAMKFRTATEPAGQFLISEFGPNTPKSKPLPPELYRRLDTKSLVFYHYETTGSRIGQLLFLTQLGLMVTRHQQLSDGTASFKWIDSIAKNLSLNLPRDHTDTEITQSGPAEFTFARKSPVIFTAFEFLVLANWLEAPNFPGFDLRLPKRINPQRHAQQSFQLTPLPANAPGH